MSEASEHSPAREERSADRERSDELFARLPSDPSVRDELVKLYYPLAEYLGRRFGGRGEQLEDLVQVASIGLLKAIDRFDPGREVQFSTYATATIVGELKRHFRDKGWALRVPRRLQETGLRVNKVTAELWQQLGRTPTVKEIAARAGISDDDVLEAMDAVRAYSTTSLDAPLGEDGATPAQALGAEDTSLELLEGWASIAPLVSELPTRERRVLYLRFFADMTQTEIAEELGISQMHVSRLLSQTLARLRSAADTDTDTEGL
ncbi:MAG: RNA polymerase sigma factor SigF [Actinomycetota bacterium]|nr:RNA polymerase sigma factor SigF [Actinomycetota bacterium]